MKRITVILLLAIYLIPAIGISVSAHYCGGELAAVSMGFGAGHDCPCGTKEMKKDCCKDENSYIKIQDDQQYSARYALQCPKEFKYLQFFAVSSTYVQPSIHQQFCLSYFHPPDNKSAREIYLFNKVFLI